VIRAARGGGRRIGLVRIPDRALAFCLTGAPRGIDKAWYNKDATAQANTGGGLTTACLINVMFHVKHGSLFG